jgi:hypothetical protein
MGDRFYAQQLETLGHCPGSTNKRKKRMAWTDEKKAEVIKEYEAADPTPENSMEIVTQIANEYEESVNGVRVILSKAGVYIKKTPDAKGEGSAAKGGTRVSKQAAQEALTAAIEAAGKDADEDIISKLTGKAAQYFTALLAE